ncbi:hypothetical protein ACQ4PT_008257 [Festuca glaucescens]
METKSPPSNMDLQGAIFRLSDNTNKFTVIGCKTLAYIGDTDDVSSYTAVLLRTAIPRGLENYRVWFDQNFSTKGIGGSCSYAALVEASNFTFSASYLTSSAFMDAYGGQAPVVVDWAIGTPAGETCESARTKLSSYACVSDNSVCVDSPIGQGYICNCSKGYQGNPYLQYGCKDVDECLDKRNCDGTCHNTFGDFICCPQRTKHDPSRMQCISTKHRNIIIGVTIGLGVGLGMLLVGLCGIFLFYKWKRLADLLNSSLC